MYIHPSTIHTFWMNQKWRLFFLQKMDILLVRKWRMNVSFFYHMLWKKLLLLLWMKLFNVWHIQILFFLLSPVWVPYPGLFDNWWIPMSRPSPCFLGSRNCAFVLVLAIHEVGVSIMLVIGHTCSLLLLWMSVSYGTSGRLCLIFEFSSVPATWVMYSIHYLRSVSNGEFSIILS